MAGYEPKNWQCGDTITADDLNHMEQGIANAGGGALVVKLDRIETEEQGGQVFNKYIFDKTWQQVSDAYDAGLPIYHISQAGTRLYLSYANEGQVSFSNIRNSDSTDMISDSPDGYLYFETDK